MPVHTHTAKIIKMRLDNFIYININKNYILTNSISNVLIFFLYEDSYKKCPY